jgi:tetratricopeptide (TPR) repeat protein
MKGMGIMKKMSWLAPVAAVFLAGVTLRAAEGDEKYIVLSQGEKIVTTVLFADATGAVTYQLPGGTATNKVNLGSYQKAYIPMPPEVKEMQAAMAGRNYAGVMAACGRAVAKNYQFLGWGGWMMLCEGNAHLALGNASMALASYDRGINLPPDQYRGDLYRGKVGALMRLDRKDDAKAVVEKMFTQADAKTVAFAFNTRAELLAKEGKRREAILDYLKTILLCKTDEASEARETAKSQVKALLTELKDPRAGEIDKID